MKHKKAKLCAVLLLVLGITVLHAQESIPASGGNAAGSGGSVSYTVGQVVYTAHAGTNGSTAQGVQQPYEISVVTALPEAGGIYLICQAYPNPAAEFVKLEVENHKTGNLTYQLYDSNGKLLETQKVESNETSIDMSKLVIATYFLKVRLDNKEIKTFKIIKY
jgi:hypothetical protein